MKKVLIVDDASFMRCSLRTILEKCGFEVVGEAENGMAAVTLYNELKPDIVTLDIKMPDVDGIEALRRIKEVDRNARVIMISSMGQKELVQDAIMAGAVAFIVKPFKENLVVQALMQTASNIEKYKA